MTDEACIELVRQYHRTEDIDVPNEDLHYALHTAVENQAAMEGQTPVADVLRRLQEDGLDRHQAVHAVAGVLVRYLVGEDAGRGDAGAAYFDEVRALPAQDWEDRAE
jgi:hypothetical protein